MSKRIRKPIDINYSGIDKFSFRYWFIHTYAELTLRYVYHNRYEVINIENIPSADTPLMVVSNHHSGLNDALCILFMFPDRRQAVFIARSDAFRVKIAAVMLRFLKILPAFRNQDGEDPRRNNSTFQVAASVLQNHHTLIMFPEGEHHADHWMWPFRRGFARVAFKAEENCNFTLGTQILPLGLYYTQHMNMRKDVAIVVGKPVPLSDYLDLYHQAPEKAQLALMRDMEKKVSELALDFGTEDDYNRYNTARLMYEHRQMRKMGLDHRRVYSKLMAGKEVAKRLKMLKATDEHKQQHILYLSDSVHKGLQQLGLRHWLLYTNITLAWLAPRSLLLVLLAPLYALLWVLNVLPYNAPKLVTTKVPDPMMHPTLIFGISVLVTFPVFYLAYAILISKWLGSYLYALAAIPLLLAGLVAFFYYRKAFVKLSGAWRYYLLARARNGQLAGIKEEYTQLMREMDELMAN